MPNPDLTQFIQKLNSFENVRLTHLNNITFPPSAYKVSGAYKVTGVTYRIRADGYDSGAQDLQVVMSVPIIRLNDRVNRAQKIVASENLLIDKKVSSVFNHTYLYRGTEGRLVSWQAPHGDLHRYAHDNLDQFSLNDVKGLIIQILLAVDNYHKKDLAHRDLKPENFLVYSIGEKVILKLADHDDVIEIDAEGIPVDQTLPMTHGTRAYAAPELILAIKRKLTSSLNLKAIDCYAIGKTIEKVCKSTLKIDDKNIYHLECVNVQNNQPPGNGYPVSDMSVSKQYHDLAIMVRQLKLHDVSHRMTITEALYSSFFGERYDERRKFHDTVREEAKYSFTINATKMTQSSKVNNAYLLLDNKIKSIIDSGFILNNYFNNINPALADTHTRFCGVVRTFKSAKLHTTKLKNRAKTFDKEYYPQILIELLNEFEAAVKSHLHRLNEEFYNNLSRAIKLSIENSLALCNQGFTPGLFSLHKNYQIEMIHKLNLEISDTTPYLEAFKKIHDFIKTDKSDFSLHLANNFKSILHVPYSNLAKVAADEPKRKRQRVA